MDATESPDSKKQTEKTQKKRSREGCFVCRSRKKRCDLTRPVCGTCARLGFACNFPPQITDENGHLVTVKQPNKRKKPNKAADASASQQRGGAEDDSKPPAPKKPRASTTKETPTKASATASNGRRSASGSTAGGGDGGSVEKVDVKGKGRAAKGKAKAQIQQEASLDQEEDDSQASSSEAGSYNDGGGDSSFVAGGNNGSMLGIQTSGERPTSSSSSSFQPYHQPVQSVAYQQNNPFPPLHYQTGGLSSVISPHDNLRPPSSSFSHATTISPSSHHDFRIPNPIPSNNNSVPTSFHHSPSLPDNSDSLKDMFDSFYSQNNSSPPPRAQSNQPSSSLQQPALPPRLPSSSSNRSDQPNPSPSLNHNHINNFFPGAETPDFFSHPQFQTFLSHSRQNSKPSSPFPSFQEWLHNEPGDAPPPGALGGNGGGDSSRSRSNKTSGGGGAGGMGNGGTREGSLASMGGSGGGGAGTPFNPSSWLVPSPQVGSSQGASGSGAGAGGGAGASARLEEVRREDEQNQQRDSGQGQSQRYHLPPQPLDLQQHHHSHQQHQPTDTQSVFSDTDTAQTGSFEPSPPFNNPSSRSHSLSFSHSHPSSSLYQYNDALFSFGHASSSSHTFPFDPTYPHLVPIETIGQPTLLPHQRPSPFLQHTHADLPGFEPYPYPTSASLAALWQQNLPSSIEGADGVRIGGAGERDAGGEPNEVREKILGMEQNGEGNENHRHNHSQAPANTPAASSNLVTDSSNPLSADNISGRKKPASTSNPAASSSSTTANTTSSSSLYRLPSPFLAASLSYVPDDEDAEVTGFVLGTSNAKKRSNSNGSGSSSVDEVREMYRQRAKEAGSGAVVSSPSGSCLSSSQHQQNGGLLQWGGNGGVAGGGTGGRQTLMIGPNLRISLPELPPYVATQAPLLVDYFIRKLAPLISVLTPAAVNSSLNVLSTIRAPASSEGPGWDVSTVFLPLALKSELVMMGVLAWASMHLADAGDPWKETSDYLQKQAEKRMQKTLAEWEAGGGRSNQEEILAGLVMLSEIEICRGSTNSWYKYLTRTKPIIRSLGGPKELLKVGPNIKWLLQNISYHELLSSFTPYNGPALEPDEYAAILGMIGGPGIQMNSYMGACQPIFQILAEISRLSVEAARCATYVDRDERIESLRVLAAKESRLKARLDTVYPNFASSEDPTTPAHSYHFVTFRCFVLTARLYLRQVCSHCNAFSLVSQLLVAQLLASIQLVLNTPAESSLLFPIFIAGCDAAMERDRKEVKAHFTTLDQNTRIGNISSAFALLEKIWERNEEGEKWVDWPKLAQECGWNVSFA